MENQNDSEREPEHQRRLPCLTIMALSICFNIINHALIGFVAVYMTLMCSSAELKPMTWHAWSCTIGYQVLMLEGIMVFYSENVWSSQLEEKTKRSIHWIIQAIGSLLALSGIIVQYVNYKGEHFQTKHSIVGLISAIFLLISLCGGVVTLKAFHLRNVLRPAVVKFFHYAVGIVTIVLGLVALCYGYDKRFMRANSDEDIRYYLRLIAWCTAAFSLIGALQSLERKINVILWTR